MAAPEQQPPIVAFGVYDVDLRAAQLHKHGLKVKLQDQPFRILAMLLEHPGEVVSRETLRQQLWPTDVFLDFDHSLNKAINKLREALSDSADNPRFIETIPRRGYRFIAPVQFQVAHGVPAGSEPRRREADRHPAGPASAAAGAIGVGRATAGQERAAAGSYDTLGAEEARSLPSRWGFRMWIWPVALLALAAGAVVWFRVLRPASQSSPLMTPVPLTTYPGRERQGALSPDGKQVAFVWTGEKGAGYDLYVKLTDAGKPLRLTDTPGDEFSPTWSPDDHHIAFYRESSEGHEILVIPALGGAERKLGHSAASGTGFGMSWSPDGKWLAVVDRDSPQVPNSVYLLSLETGEKHKVTTPPAQVLGDSFPAFSPDGKRLAFARVGKSASDVFLVSVAGGTPRQITFNHSSFAGVAWSPNGSKLVFASRRVGGSSLWRVSASGGEPERLPVGGENAHFPSISREGNRLVFTETFLNTNIWRIEISGSAEKPPVRTGAPTRLIFSTRREDSPHYSPDGKRIAFASDRSGFPEIWASDSDGLNPVKLTSFGGPLTGSPRWSPDGREIAFDSRREGNADIYVLAVEGGPPRRLTTEKSDEMVPGWSRDGRWIYFASDRSGDLQVWKMPAGGGPALRVTRKGGFEAFESPDGKFLYYTKRRDVNGIYRVGVEGGEELPVPELSNTGYRRNWVVAGGGIYFVPHEASSRPAIKFFSFATHRITPIAVTEKELVGGPPSLAVSPDGRWILYAQVDRRDADLTLVEDFR